MLGMEESRELLTWKTFAGRATWLWFSLEGSLVLVVSLSQLQWQAVPSGPGAEFASRLQQSSQC